MHTIWMVSSDINIAYEYINGVVAEHIHIAVDGFRTVSVIGLQFLHMLVLIVVVYK